MGKRVLIISSSPRKNGNSDTLCHSFARGAKEKGKATFERAAACIDGLCDCLSDIKIKGMIYAGGVWKKGEIDSTKYIQQAYDMGAAV